MDCFAALAMTESAMWYSGCHCEEPDRATWQSIIVDCFASLAMTELCYNALAALAMTELCYSAVASLDVAIHLINPYLKSKQINGTF